MVNAFFNTFDSAAEGFARNFDSAENSWGRLES